MQKPEQRTVFVPGQPFANRARYWMRYHMMANGRATRSMDSIGHHHIANFCYGRSDITITKLQEVCDELKIDFTQMFDPLPDHVVFPDDE